MKDLSFLEENGVDISKFILSPYPTVEWNITQQRFTEMGANRNLDAQDELKVYTIQSVKLNVEYLNNFKKHKGYIAWIPSEEEQILRFALLKERPILTKFYVFGVFQGTDLKIIPDFRIFNTEEEVLEYHLERINLGIVKIIDFRVIEGVEKTLEPYEVVTKYTLK